MKKYEFTNATFFKDEHGKVSMDIGEKAVTSDPQQVQNNLLLELLIEIQKLRRSLETPL